MTATATTDLRTLAADVAAALGAHWHTPAQGPAGAQQQELHGPGGAVLLLCRGLLPDRLEVHGLYPRTGHDGRAHRSTIVLVLHRGADSIATAVRDRLLPTYLPALQAAYERLADSAATAARRLAVRDQLQQELPGTTAPAGQHPGALQLQLPSGQGGVQLHTAEHGSLQLEGVPVGLLRVVLAALAAELYPGAVALQGAHPTH